MQTRQIIINYWIGEKTNNSLDQVPPYVDIVPLAFVGINPDFSLSFTFLTQQYSADEIKASIRRVRRNGTKVLLSFREDKRLGLISRSNAVFVENVVDAVVEWGVDGLDFDYETSPFVASETLVGLIEELRAALCRVVEVPVVFTAPVYRPWLRHPGFLRRLAGAVDYVSTMDYTPYPGFERTIADLKAYAGIIGGWDKLVVGVSCMSPEDPRPFKNCTPLEDVKALAAFGPAEGVSKGGVMLWTFTYDVTRRNRSEGTGLPDGTYTRVMYESLPGS